MSEQDSTTVPLPADEGWADWWRVLRTPGGYREDGAAPAANRTDLARAFGALVEEQDDDAHRLLQGPLTDRSLGGWQAVALALQAIVLARRGAPAAGELRRAAETAAARHDLHAAWVELAAALIDLEHGNRNRALQVLLEVGRRFTIHREPIGRIHALVWAGRIELLLGRAARGRARIAGSLEAARVLGLGALAALAERSSRIPLLPRAEPTTTLSLAAPGLGLGPRERAIAAFAAAAGEGDETLAEALLDACAREVEGADHAVERLVLAAGRAFLERRRGFAASLQAHLREAARVAAEAEIDADHYRVLAQLVQQAQVIHRGSRRFLSEVDRPAGVLPPEWELVLDARRHELRAGERVISFRRKPVVRRLFYALAAHVGKALTKDVLAQAAWGSDYNPLVHEDVLRVNIQHLRRAIEPAGLTLWFDDVGYRLDAPEEFVFIECVEGIAS